MTLGVTGKVDSGFFSGAAGDQIKLLVDIFLFIPSVSLASSEVLRAISMIGLRKQAPSEGHTGALLEV